MVSRMWNELFKLQEKYSDYRHGGTGAVKRIDKSSGAKAIRQAKYEALQEVDKVWQSVWDDSEGNGKSVRLSIKDIDTIHKSQSFIDPKDGDIWFEYNNRHFDTMEELVAQIKLDDTKRLIYAEDVIKHLMKAMSWVNDDGEYIEGDEKKNLIKDLIDGVPDAWKEES